MKTVKVIASVLLVIGGLNWLVIGLGGSNIVAMLGATIAQIAYILVGLAAIVEIVGWFSKGDSAM